MPQYKLCGVVVEVPEEKAKRMGLEPVGGPAPRRRTAAKPVAKSEDE